MNWFLSLFIGLITGGVGLLTTGFLATLNVRWYRISSFEGGSGYYVLGLALLGGFVGVIVGVVAARVVAGWSDPTFLKGLGTAVASMLALVLGVGVLCRLGADLEPTIDGKPLDLAVEIRTPRGFSPDFAREPGYTPYLYLETASGKTKATGEIKPEYAVAADGGWVYAMTVGLPTRASGKRIRAYFNKTYDATFLLPLRGVPRKSDLVWTPWIRAGWPGVPDGPSDEDSFWLRYRVVVIEPAQPQPAEVHAGPSREELEEAAFDALAPDAPLADWLPYTAYGTPEDRLQAAIRNIEAREDLAEALRPIVLGEDGDQAGAALRMIARFETFKPDLPQVVTEAGRAIIDRIHTFNTTPVDQDPSMLGAADVSLRFSGWMEAVRALRMRTGVEFTTELGEILTLSRVREDSHCMQVDVRRVASYYMKEWAGLEPLPGDPKPR